MKQTICAAALMVLVGSNAFAAEMTGYISDEACATKSAKAATAMEWIKPDAFERCVKECAKDGSALVFLTEDNKILRVDAASQPKIAAHAGQRVKVTGSVSNGVLTVESMAMLQMPKK